jgi:hypothetical protein
MAVGPDTADPPTVEQLLRRVAAHGLPGQPDRICDEPPAADVWSSLIGRVGSQRLQGLLLAAVGAGALPVTDEQRDTAVERHFGACVSVLRLEHRLLEATDVLEDAGIQLLALKGSALAHLAYPDPAWRVFNDVDVLVPGEQLGAALATLTAAFGATRPVPEVRSGYDRRFAKSVTLRCPDGIELDVHRNLVFGTFGFAIDLGELSASAHRFELGDRRIATLGPEARLLHACYHAGLGDRTPRYNSVRDVAQLLLTGDQDPCEVLALAERWRSLAVLQRGIRLCRALLGVEVTGPLADATADYRPSKQEARAIASYVGADRSHAAKVLASVPFIDGLRAKAAFLIANLGPSRRLLERRHGRGAWVGRAWRALQRRPR